MASFRCYDNPNVIATLIIANFHLYLTQLWRQFFTIFVYGDVVYAQTWAVLTGPTSTAERTYEYMCIFRNRGRVNDRNVCFRSSDCGNGEKIFKQVRVLISLFFCALLDFAPKLHYLDACNRLRQKVIHTFMSSSSSLLPQAQFICADCKNSSKKTI